MIRDIEIEGRKLVVNMSKSRLNERISINILAEEIGINSNNREYRTILIDRPLIDLESNQFPSLMIQKKVNSIISEPITPKLLSNLSSSQLIGFNIKNLKNQDDCSRYLESISQKITLNLESDMKLMQSNYIIISKFLNDAAERMKNLCESYIPQYENIVVKILESNQNSKNSKKYSENITFLNCDNIRLAIRISVETYTCYLLHGKLMTSLYSLYEDDDEKLMKNYQLIMESAPDISHLGAQAVFSDYCLSEQLVEELELLPQLQSPLAILSSLTRIIELINFSLNLAVELSKHSHFDHRLGANNFETISICSDDLIASLVYSLARVKPAKLFSLSKYLDLFGWTSTSYDQPAYYAATFQVVVLYIHGYLGENSPESKEKNE